MFIRRLCGDVFVNYLLQRAVCDKFFERRVYGVFEFRIVFRNRYCVIFIGIRRFKYLQALVSGNVSLCGFVVYDNAVNFACFERFNGNRTVRISNNVVFAEITGSVNIAGGCFLNAYLLPARSSIDWIPESSLTITT